MPSVSLVGCGRWGRNILRDLLSLGCDVAVADPNPAAQQTARAAGAFAAEPAFHRLPKCDGVVIATPTSTHAAVIEEALDRRLPIFVEKPMTSDAVLARAIAERAAGRVFVMDKWRYHPGVAELARIARERELGAPIGMRLRHEGWGNPHQDVDITWILLPHCLSMFLEIFGHLPEPVYSFAERLQGRAVALSGVLRSAVWAAIDVSARAPVKTREFRLHCEGGIAWLDEGLADHIKIARGWGHAGASADNVERRPISTELPLLAELRTFAAHLGGGPAPKSSAADGALTVERIWQLRRMAGLE